MFQTRSRHEGEPAQLTWDRSCSALQLGRDFRQQLFCRIPPSRLSGKTKCDCVLASSSSLIMKYHIPILYRKKAVLSISFLKKEKKRRYNQTGYNKQGYNRIRYNDLSRMIMGQLFIFRISIPFADIDAKINSPNTILQKHNHEKAILLKTREQQPSPPKTRRRMQCSDVKYSRKRQKKTAPRMKIRFRGRSISLRWGNIHKQRSKAETPTAPQPTDHSVGFAELMKI